MLPRLLWPLLFIGLPAVAQQAPRHAIVAGPQNGTYFQVAHDLADLVAGPAELSLQVLPSKGSVENIRRLRDEPGTKLALVQSDVYRAFQDEAAAGNAEAARVVAPVRVVMPMYDEEVHFLVRADSPLNHVHEIRDARINIGPPGSGAAMTAATLYRLMFGTGIDAAQASTLPHEEALIRLARERSLDVVVIVAGQPTPYLTGMEPGVEKHFKLLKFDASAPGSAALGKTYAAATLKAASYPRWLAEDLPSLAVKTYLVTYDYRADTTQRVMERFAASLCRRFAVLQREGHPKWRQVALHLPTLAEGWRYYGPTERTLTACPSAAPTTITIPAPTRTPAACPVEREALGFCKR